MSFKKIVITILSIGASYLTKAQEATSTAAQQTALGLEDVVGVSLFSDNGGGNGNGGGVVEMPIGGVNALADGIESPAIEIKLQSTTAFDVSISSSSNTFAYTGPSTFGTTMNVTDVLDVMITENGTGGTIGSGFSQYQPVNGTTKKPIINSGQPGVRTFAFKYKANPGFNYPAGTYTTDIIYTIVKK